MNLFIIWICFVFLMTVSKQLDQYHYMLFSVSMLYFTYVYNRIYPIRMSLRATVMFLIIPSTIFWYIAFVYNNFLCLTPLNYDLLACLLFIYVYLTTYIFWECP